MHGTGELEIEVPTSTKKSLPVTSKLGTLDLHLPSPGTVPALPAPKQPPVLREDLVEPLSASPGRYLGDMGVGEAGRAEEPEVGLPVVAEAAEPACTHHPHGRLAQERHVLRLADGVRAGASAASVPVRLAGVPGPRHRGE